jgi:hypothetical protein
VRQEEDVNDLIADPTKIPGWGVDADPENDPTYPYRDRSKDDGLMRNWQRPPQQQSSVEILQSIEHLQRPAVFGTSTPPKWLSGMLRRGAFRYSESHWGHWLMLMAADRINVVEGIVEDLGRAKVPNIPGEMGIRAELRHNKLGLAKKVAVAGAVSGVLYLLLRSSGKKEAEPEQPVSLTPEREVADGESRPLYPSEPSL